jgi:hypothetical protein
MSYNVRLADQATNRIVLSSSSVLFSIAVL